MVEVRRSTIVDAPIEDVWAILRDFNGHDHWHPAVSRSMIEDGHPSDVVGAVRDFRLSDGSRIREQLLSLSDRAHSFAYCILEAPLPLIGYVASVQLKPVTDGNRTYWEWCSHFEPPPSRKQELVRLVGERIYEDGFRAIKDLLLGNRSRLSVAPVAGRGDDQLTRGETAANAIVMERHGGPEVLQYRTIRVPQPVHDEVRIRQSAIGVNYIDIYARTGYFDLVQPPGIPGMEAAGVIESVGAGVTDFKVGDRVGYACTPPGAYTELRVIKPDLLVPLPDTMSDQAAAASLLKGITAGFLLHEVYAVKLGDMILVHAAAGGVGTFLCQWASALGAIVIGTVSGQAKAEHARAAGVTHVIDYAGRDFVEEVLSLTAGRGVNAAFDAVGKDTFEGSIQVLKPRGHLVSFGQASGDIGSYEIGKLASRSITLSRPNYAHYTGTTEDVRRQAVRFFHAVDMQLIRIDRPHIYKLSDAARAHSDLESRTTVGSLILVP